MAKALVIACLVAGCSSSHDSTVSARTDCATCHTAPVIGDPVPAPCAEQDHSTYASTCYECHGTTAWCPALPATQNHLELSTFVDITTPSHAGWDCASCHPAIVYDPPTLPAKGDELTCINCHWHSKDQTDPRHLGKGDYSYGPVTCIQDGCHGKGVRL